MGKLIDEPITPNPSQSLFEQQLIPHRFTWRGREYRVETIGGEWRILGRWWEGEAEQRFVRALTSRGLAMDLCQDTRTGQWTLHELQD